MDEHETTLRPEWFWDGDPAAGARRGVEVRLRGGKIVEFREGVPADAEMRGVLLTPGMTNFHCHLELSHVPRPAYGGAFVPWLLEVMRKGPATGDAAAAAAVAGVEESVRSGVTGIVDVTRNPAAVRAAIGGHAGIRPGTVTLCTEVTGLGPRHANGRRMIEAGAWDGSAGEVCRPGWAPHAPYSTAAEHYAECARRAREHGATLTTHLCETADERRFLAEHSGAFRELWEAIGGWDEAEWGKVERFAGEGGGPVRWLESVGALRGMLVAHVNDVDEGELDVLARNGCTVVHCPRTHAYFGRGRFEVERFRRWGIEVKLGTDSRASAGDLDLMADVRAAARAWPGMGAGEVWGMAMGGRVGFGSAGDLVGWRVPVRGTGGTPVTQAVLEGPHGDGDPVEAVVRGSEEGPAGVWVGGKRVV